MKTELRALTAARGIAAWLVVLFHIRQSLPALPGPIGAVLDKGYLAVDFFFLLSGFVIWISWSERLRGGGPAAIPEFLRRRIARIWPLHLVMLGFGLCLALALAATGRETPQFPLAELPLHLALLQNWGFTSELAWNDPAWSISCELAAYLLFPLLVLTIDWRRVPTPAILAALAALLMLLQVVFAAYGTIGLGERIPRLGLLRCILEFACGTAVGALWLHWRDRWRTPALLAFALAALLLGGWIAGPLPETLAVPAAFAGLLLALALSAGRPRNPLEVAPLHYLGEISYATYLSHFLLWFAFKLAFVDDPDAVRWPLIAAYLVLVLASSAALYHAIERPAQRWLNRLPFRRPRRAPTAGSR
ncbi:acyltransferase [Sphingomonas sp. DG1-23]|uniref:acyltransferase family protein n=1 Tax=Sphingomonas sp. DG1-23 TaxID=3068316 RepID=UPI00273DFD9B|nr:acyltransferase [Sphingomonas sp. DG1-23]MDP5280248.1 acyltransferase [Sphingomonas sp. DG1-23]